MCAAITMAFYGFLRFGKFTSLNSNFDASYGLLRDDIWEISRRYSTTGILIFLKASKTDSFRSRTTINLFQTGGITCPFTAINRYINLWDSLSDDAEVLISFDFRSSLV